MLSLPWKVRGLVCRGMVSDRDLLCPVIAGQLGDLSTSHDQKCLGFVCRWHEWPLVTWEHCLWPSLQKEVVQQGCCIRGMWLGFWLTQARVSCQSRLHNGLCFLFYLVLVDLLLPVSHSVYILTHYCSFDCPISSSDFWESFTERKLQYKQQK